MDNKKYWIWLTRIPKLNSILIMKLLEKYKTPENIWNLSKQELELVEGIEEEKIINILDKKYKIGLDAYIKYMRQNDIDIITVYDKEYPKKLKNIYDKPIVIYIKGNKEILNQKNIAIVGTRHPSLYGKITAERLAYQLSKQNINIVSGLAIGIDANAHLGVIRNRRKDNCRNRKWS